MKTLAFALFIVASWVAPAALLVPPPVEVTVDLFVDPVPDFVNIVDSVTLMLTNRNNSQVIVENQPGTKITAVATIGTYQVYLSTKRGVNPKPFEKKAQFMATKDTVQVTTGVSITLTNVTCLQSVILLNKTGVTGIPSIQVGEKWYTFFEDVKSPKYWIAYVAGASRVTVLANIGGGNKTKTFNITKRAIHMVNMVSLTVDVKDIFNQKIDT